jgi:hypothetical protein
VATLVANSKEQAMIQKHLQGMNEAKYTEQQLRRAFECGQYAGLQYDDVCKKIRADGPQPATEELLDMDTPLWVHNTNMSLFVWQFISWDVVRDKWILRPERPDDLLETTDGRRIACDGDARKESAANPNGGTQ